MAGKVGVEPTDFIFSRMMFYPLVCNLRAADESAKVLIAL